MLKRVKIAISAPSVLAGIGSVIVSFPINKIASLIFLITTIWTAINEITVEEGQTVGRSAAESAFAATGFASLFKEIQNSPAFFRWIQGVNYLFTAAGLFVAGKIAVAFDFVAFAIGVCATIPLANAHYHPPLREKTVFESFLLRTWSQMPLKLRLVLRDPGATFGLGNLSLLLKGTDFTTFMHASPLIIGLALLGLTCAVIGILRGFAPLLLNRVIPTSGVATAAIGSSELCLGTVSLLYGNPYTGAATLFWGLTNIMICIRMRATKDVR